MRNKNGSGLFMAAMAATAITGCAAGADLPASPIVQAKSFVVLALSRGKGVPVPARALLDKVQALLEETQHGGTEMTVSTSRIGLEGETKLCAQFTDPELGGRWFAKIQSLARGIDLINVAIEPCGDQP